MERSHGKEISRRRPGGQPHLNVMPRNKSIFNATMRWIDDLRALGFDPPKTIILSSHDDGMRLLHEITELKYLTFRLGDLDFGLPVEAPDGSVWMQIQVYGVEFRWPALRFAEKGGGFK